MFNVGGMELLVIALVALLVLGPDKLPGAIRQLGQVTGELRRISQGFQTDLKGALDDAEKQAERESKAEKDAVLAASAAGPSNETPDPGAGIAAAEAELAAMDNASAADVVDASGGVAADTTTTAAVTDESGPAKPSWPLIPSTPAATTTPPATTTPAATSTPPATPYTTRDDDETTDA